jgi:hypothetical protein
LGSFAKPQHSKRAAGLERLANERLELRVNLNLPQFTLRGGEEGKGQVGREARGGAGRKRKRPGEKEDSL